MSKKKAMPLIVAVGGLLFLSAVALLAARLEWVPKESATIPLFLSAAMLFGLWYARTRRDVFLTIVSLFAILAFVEIAMLVYSRVAPPSENLVATKFEYVPSEKFVEGDPDLTYVHKRNLTVTESKAFDDGEYAYREVEYIFDAKGRRVCSTHEAEDAAPQHALFLGGSFTFGMGVETESILPCRFEDLAHGEYQSYNYGVGGHGPSQMYLLSRRDELFDDIPQKEGIAVYSYIGDHLNRITPYRAHLIKGFAYYPFFDLDDTGELVGPFRYKQHPAYRWREKIYDWSTRYSASGKVLLPRYNVAYKPKTEALAVAAKLITETKRLYDARFDGDFYVILWPRNYEEGPALDAFVDSLEREGIVVLNPGPMPADRGNPELHPRDPHPSAAEYQWVAERFHAAVAGQNVDDKTD